jgi:hypothetical protein
VALGDTVFVAVTTPLGASLNVKEGNFLYGVGLPTGYCIDACPSPGALITLKTGKVLLINGRKNQLYDPATGAWKLTGSCVGCGTPYRFGSRSYATLLPDGKVLWTGGLTNTITAGSFLYDPVAETWSPTRNSSGTVTAMTIPRYGHTTTLLPNGKVLVAGGFGSPFAPGANAQPVLDSAELYDPATGVWTPTGSLNTRRALHTAILLPNGKVLVAGGRTCNVPPPSACNFTFRSNTAELYDPATGVWTPTAAMNVDRHTTSSALLLNGKVLVPAGFTAAGNGINGDVYDPTTATWSLTGNLNVGRARQGAMLLPDGTVLVAAGFGGGNTAELYDPATNSWTLTGNVAVSGRFNFQYAVMPNGKALIAGGVASGAPVRSSEVYNPATHAWTSGGTMAHDHGSSSSLSYTRQAVVLSASPTSFVSDPRVCGRNCGKVLVAGDNADGGADLYTPATVPLTTCSSTYSGQVSGNINVPAGSVACVTGAQVTGSVIVASGGAVVLTNADIRGNLQIDGAAGVRMCGARVVGATSITHSFGPVVVGDAGDDGTPACAMNRFSGPVTLDANQWVEVGGNQFAKALSVTWTAGAGPSAEDAVSEIEANAVITSLSCANNTPAPTNDGRPNQVYGTRSGQCSAAGF